MKAKRVALAFIAALLAFALVHAVGVIIRSGGEAKGRIEVLGFDVEGFRVALRVRITSSRLPCLVKAYVDGDLADYTVVRASPSEVLLSLTKSYENLIGEHEVRIDLKGPSGELLDSRRISVYCPPPSYRVLRVDVEPVFHYGGSYVVRRIYVEVSNNGSLPLILWDPGISVYIDGALVPSDLRGSAVIIEPGASRTVCLDVDAYVGEGAHVVKVVGYGGVGYGSFNASVG